MLSEQQIDDFNTRGYCVLPDFKTQDQINAIKAAARRIIDKFEPEADPRVFASGDDDMDQYLLETGYAIACFLEPDLTDEAGRLSIDKHTAVNKIGHALHDLDPDFDNFSRDERLASVATALGIAEPQIWQSMYIQKSPRVGGEVRWHQDATYFNTYPLSVVTFWFALDDADQENGCLWVDKAGAQTPLREVFELKDGKTEIHTLDTTPWPNRESAEPLEVKAGTLVCFKGTLPHYSAPNTSERPRHAYTLHVTDARTTYSEANWLQREDVRGFV